MLSEYVIVFVQRGTAASSYVPFLWRGTAVVSPLKTTVRIACPWLKSLSNLLERPFFQKGSAGEEIQN